MVLIRTLSKLTFNLTRSPHFSCTGSPVACLVYRPCVVYSRNYSIFETRQHNTLNYVCGVNVNVKKYNYEMMLTRGFAARKGTRERREKLKKKMKLAKQAKEPEVKLTFKEKLRRTQLAEEVYVTQRPWDDNILEPPVDDVFYHMRFRDTRWPFKVALENHREIHHESMIDRPKAALYLRINIDMTYPNRPKKFMETWKSIVEMKKPFLLEGMVRPCILVFCPEKGSVAMIDESIKAGADKAGSVEMIRMIQEGHISANDYEMVVAHPLIVNELTAIRGLLKGKFPSIRTKTIEVNVPALVKRIKGGAKYTLNKSPHEPDFAFIHTPIGTLDMDASDLEGNFEAFVLDVLPKRLPGKDPNEFIVGCTLQTDFSQERFKLDISHIIEKHLQEPVTDDGGVLKKKRKSKKVEVDIDDESKEKDDDEDPQKQSDEKEKIPVQV